MIDQVTLCGHRFSVKHVEHVGDHVIANSDYAAGTIHILPDLPTDVYYCTLIHEVIHLIMNIDGMREAHSERDICALANGVFQFIKDNPAIIQKILSDTVPVARQSVTAVEPVALHNNAASSQAARARKSTRRA
ncbi:MAG: hypothetical protein NTV22_11245 [bacterium]|nr:hypothetical protein [bacterium]